MRAKQSSALGKPLNGPRSTAASGMSCCGVFQQLQQRKHIRDFRGLKISRRAFAVNGDAAIAQHLGERIGLEFHGAKKNDDIAQANRARLAGAIDDVHRRAIGSAGDFQNSPRHQGGLALRAIQILAVGFLGRRAAEQMQFDRSSVKQRQVGCLRIMGRGLELLRLVVIQIGGGAGHQFLEDAVDRLQAADGGCGNSAGDR